jgi:hypothetical protein
MSPEQAAQLNAAQFREHAAALRPETRMLIDGEMIDC